MAQSVKIALLGFTHTGKTCIAANFANINGFHGTNRYTKDFLCSHAQRIEKMRAGDMSDPFPPTQHGAPNWLSIHDAENGIDIKFAEYAGEILDKTKGQIDILEIPKQDGVLLLLSAREPIVGDGEDPRNRIDAVKIAFGEILAELTKSPKPIVFLVTAADVLLDKTVDHTPFFELKNFIEDRIKGHDLEITDTKYVSIITAYHRKKITGVDGEIISSDTAIKELVKNILSNRPPSTKRLKQLICTVIIIAVAIGCVIVSQSCKAKPSKPVTCTKCKSDLVDGKCPKLCKTCDEHLNQHGECQKCIETDKFQTLCNEKDLSTALNNFQDIQFTKSEEIADACAGILLEKIAGEWEKKFKKPSYDKRFFDDLITDCRRIKGIDNSAIKSSPVYKFAVAYSVFYKHGLTVKFHTIEFSMDKDSVKQYLLKGFVFKNQSDDNTKTIDFKKTEVSSKEKTINFPTEISIKPWDRPGVWLQRKISGFKTELGTDSWDFNIHTGNGSYSFLWKNPGMYITIHYEVSGYTFPKLLNECFDTDEPDKDAILGEEE